MFRFFVVLGVVFGSSFACAAPTQSPLPLPQDERATELARIKNPDVRSLLQALPSGEAIPRTFLFSRDGQSLVSWGYNLKMIMLRSQNTKVESVKWPEDTYDQISTPYAEFERWRWAIEGGAFSPDGRYLALARQMTLGQYPLDYGERDIALVDTGTLRIVRTLPRPEEGIYRQPSLSFSSDGKQLVVGSSSGQAAVYEVASGKTLAQWSHPQSGRLSVAFVPTPSGERAVALAYRGDMYDSDQLFSPWFHNGTPELWDIAGNRPLAAFGQVAAVQGAMFSADGSRLLMVGSVNESFTTADGKFTRPGAAVPGILIAPLSFNSDGSVRSQKPTATRLDAQLHGSTFVLTPDEKNMLKFDPFRGGLRQVAQISQQTPTL